MVIGKHYKRICCYVAPKLNYPIILGIPWMKRHHVKPDFCDYSVTFTPDICALCLPCKIPCTVLGTQPKRATHSTIVDGISISTVFIRRVLRGLTE
jgi:hypothetical protein